MDELQLSIETDRDLGTREMADRFLAVLDEHPRFRPELFGQDEPLRTRYVSANREALTELWSGRTIRPGFQSGRILLKRNRAVGYLAVVAWVRGQSKMNSITVSIPKKYASRGVADEMLALGRELFKAIRGQYGFACERAEYVSKNMVGWWKHPRTGRLQGGKHLGFDRTRCLPGIYWANFFGPAYVEFFGAERLDSAPASRRERLDMGGELLLTADSPADWNTAQTRILQQRLNDHLGADAFFDIRSPKRETRAPRLALATSVGGLLGGVTKRPIAHDFIRSQEEAHWFIEHVLDLVGRLRMRLGGTLDLSPRSLRAVDALAKRDDGLEWSATDRDLVLELAAYYGEVVRRNLDGKWEISSTDTATPVIVLPSPLTDEDPFVRAVKLLQDRAPLFAWYELLASRGDIALS